MTVATPSSLKLADRIKHAIADGKLTHAEYEELLAIAHEDGRIDAHERALFDELLHLIDNKSVVLSAD